MITVGDNVAVYHDGGGQSQYHFNMLKEVKFNKERHYYEGADSFDHFLQSAHKTKFAGFHVPFPDETHWEIRADAARDHVDHVFIFCSELHRATARKLKSLDKPKVSIYVNGIFNEPFEHAQIYPWMDWFIQPLYLYKDIQPNLLEQKLLPSTKPLMFDVLLGAQRDHRDFVHYFIEASINVKLYYKTYSQRVLYYGHELGLSQVIPTKIYNQTNYSLIAETNARNDFSFPTEKVTKPLMAGRLFVAIAGQYYLRNLRSFGFKTFDSIIDESYDAEPDPIKRWSMAMQQCEWLCQQDPEVVLEQVQPIVDHNKQRIFGHDWYKEFSSLFETEIIQYLK
jgi:hypothetical protein